MMYLAIKEVTMSISKMFIGFVVICITFVYGAAEPFSQNLKRENIVFIISGPSGTGKSTLVSRLFESDPVFDKPLSITTRSPRPGEIQGVTYNYVSREEFSDMEGNGELIESMTLYGNHYGFSRKDFEDKLMLGKDLLFDGAWAGIQNIIKEKRAITVTIFMFPPSREVLEERLRGRGTDSEEMIQKRLANALQEIQPNHFYDYSFVHEDIDSSLEKLRAIIVAERMKRSRQKIPLFM
jgi:guanylate kinase